MKPYALSSAGLGVFEAAPARARIRAVSVLAILLFLMLGVRAGQLAFSGESAGARGGAIVDPLRARADIVDRNGVLLATTVRAYVLTAQPARVWDANATAARLLEIFPEMDRAVLLRRLMDRSVDQIHLRRGLSPAQRARVHDLGLAGIGFENEARRVYPHGALGGHALGYVDRDLNPLAGAERGFNGMLQGDAPLRLSIDVRVQYAAERELLGAMRASRARAGAVIVLDGRTGETLALASAPQLDPNNPAFASPFAQRNRAVGDRYEMGSTIKPFVVAMALDSGRARADEGFNLVAPFSVDGQAVRDYEPAPAQASLADILIHSSNKGAALLALRVGAARQRAYLQRLGLYEASSIETPESAAPIAPRGGGRLDTATLGFGYGLAVSPAAIAGAYTAFANEGARVRPTLRALSAGAEVDRIPVFSAEAARVTLGAMRETVRRGTGRAADVPGLALAGKTGTAEKLDGAAGYSADRNVSSFAAIFPAFAPRYVIVLALDEPARTAATGGLATGGAVAAGPVGRIAARIAPMLGLRLEPGQARASESPAR